MPHAQLFWRYRQFDSCFYAVREQRLKLIWEPDGEIALYDLIADPLETTDLSGAKPEEVRRLQDAYALWNSEITAPAAFPPKRKADGE